MNKEQLEQLNLLLIEYNKYIQSLVDEEQNWSTIIDNDYNKEKCYNDYNKTIPVELINNIDNHMNECFESYTSLLQSKQI